MLRLVLLIMFVLALAAATSTRGARADARIVLDQSVSWLSPLQSDPPVPHEPPSSQSTRLKLPDALGRRIPGVSGVVWYRLAIPAVHRDQLLALFLPHAHANVVAYVNGHWIGQGGRFAEPAAHVWNRPLFFPFDGRLLNAAGNVLQLGVQADGALYNRLDAVVLGTESALRPEYERAFHARIPVAELSTVLCATIFVIFAYIGFALRDATYIALSLSAGCYAIASLNYHLREPPISTWAFNTVTNLCLQWAGFALAHLGFLWGGMRARTMAYITFGLVGTTGAMALLLPARTFERAMMLGFMAVAAYSLAALASIWRARKTTDTREWITYFITASIWVPTGVRDILLLQDRMDGRRGPEAIYYVPYFAPILLLAAGGSLLTRFLRIYKHAQRTNEEFEHELAEKSAELESHFERSRATEQRRVLLEERERFMREIHDGVGGHLVAAVALLNQPIGATGEAQKAVRDALDDLRMVVHALDPQLGDVSMLLAEFRTRIEPRLRAQGLAFRWEVSTSHVMPVISSAEALQVLRILQEAVTNIMKHAQASTVSVRCGTDARDFESGSFIEIADDGRGITDHTGGGRGLPFMQRRARQIGARVDVTSSAQGTCVRLRFGTPGGGP